MVTRAEDTQVHMLMLMSIIIQILLHRPAAPRPAQDPAQEAGAAAHLRPGRGVEEDWSEEVRVPAPGYAEVRAAQEDCGAHTATQFVVCILSNQPLLNC